MIQAADLDLVGGTGSIAETDRCQVLIIGVGNILMGDEGVGIHVLRTLETEALPPKVQLLDGGTGGINLLESIARAPTVVMIDATRDGQPACVANSPVGLSAHDFGLRDLFAAAALLGQFPEIHLFTISVEEVNPMCLDLSPAVSAAIPEVVNAVVALTHRLV
jgi:hydrogenase maturation protease